MRKQKITEARALMDELKDLMLRDATEMSARGFYQKAMASLTGFGGSIDKNTTQVARIKELILLLDKEV